MSRLTPPLVVLVLLFALPAAAGAATFSAGTGAELAAALDTADSNGEDDVITIAAGPTALTNAAGYAYNAALTDEDNDVVINGQGRAISGSNSAVLLITNPAGPGEATVNDLRVEMVPGNQAGLDLLIGGTIAGLEISGTGALASSGLRTHRTVQASDVTITSVTQQGVMVEGDTASFTDLDVSGSTVRMVYTYGTFGVDGATFHDPASATVYGVTAEGPGTQATVRRARISGVFRPVTAAFSGAATITDSLVVLPATPAEALLATDFDNPSLHKTTIVGERLTIVGTGADGQFAVAAQGGSASEKDEMRATLRDSIVTGVDDGMSCLETNAQSVNAITLLRVNQTPAAFDQNTCDSSPQSGITRTATTNLDPAFVNPAGGDYRLRTDSPLLDVGPAAAALPGLPAKGLDGAARLNDGDGDCTAELDLGAFETQAPVFAACLPPAPAGGGGAGGGGAAPPAPDGGAAAVDRTAPVISKLKVARTIRRTAKSPVTIRFRLSEAATVKLTFRRVKGKRTVAVPGAVTLKLKAGENGVRFAGRLSAARKLRAGVYEVLATAVDAAGNRAVVRKAGFRLG